MESMYVLGTGWRFWMFCRDIYPLLGWMYEVMSMFGVDDGTCNVQM